MDDSFHLSDDEIDSLLPVQEPLVEQQCAFVNIRQERCRNMAPPGAQFCNKHASITKVHQDPSLARLQVKVSGSYHELVQSALADPDLMSNRRHIAVVEAIALKQAARLDQNCGPITIKEIQRRLKALQMAFEIEDEMERSLAFREGMKNLNDYLQGGIVRAENESNYVSTTKDLAEMKRKEIDRMEKTKQMVPITMVKQIIANFIGLVNANVKDDETKQRITRGLHQWITTGSSSSDKP